MQEQFRQAVSALREGRPQEAAQACARLLEQQPENVDVRHLYGVALLESGETERGRDSLVLAMAARPQDPEIPYNFGSALLKIGQAEAAMELFDRCLALAPGHIHARTNRASALLELDQLEAAAEGYRQVLAQAPDHASAWFNLGNAENRRGRSAAACDAYRRAVALVPDYHTARVAWGQTLLDCGQGRQAIEVLKPAAGGNADDADAWRLLGQALAADNQFEAAVEAARRATELAADDADNWNSFGAALTSMGRLEPSEAALRKALALDPEHRLASGNLAALMELSNRQDECDELTRLGLQRWPDDTGLSLTRARLLKRRGQPQQARELLQSLDHDTALPQQRRELQFLLGQVADAVGDVDAAWGHFSRANAIAAEQWRLGNPPDDVLLPAARELSATVDAAFVSGWPTADEALRRPAFLLSFQRSGTTLLDTMLGAHPGTRVMEELPVLNQLIAHIGDYPAALRKASPEQLANWRRFYFERAAELSGAALPPGTLLIDKSPLHTLHAALLQRLFPGAPIIFALRHPADVVLSCFMQDFTLSPFMLHYTTLDGVAAVYRQVMNLWQHYRSLLPLNVHELRYESLVESPKTELERVLEFLGLPWDEQVLNHAEHARGRGLINTPSYHQVTQPVYRSARGRWQRYAGHMQPVLPVLAPFCDAFGYDLAVDDECG